MNTRLLTGIILVLAFLGIADAWYLAESALTGTPLVCGIENLDGCNVVAQSVYSHLFGVPLGVYGVFFFGLIFIIAATELFWPMKRAALALFALGILGLVASIVFEGIQVFLINALCVYCLGSAVISVLIFIATLVLFRKAKPEGTPPVVTPWGSGTVLS